MGVKQKFQWEKMSLGTCYYPEHWEEALWEEDLRRMLEVGIKTVRIAEFAWSKFEPTEGNFTFEFFDRFMDLAKKVGMNVIFGTPTATPPAWLTHKYPEVLNCKMDGVPYRHGARRHYNYNSPKYLELCSIIVEKIAEHYGKHPNIVGWQIDNEINCEVDVFYSESDTFAFREFLKGKYKDLDTLNRAWGTTFWNQTYTDWEEIYVPRTTINNSTNPHEVLDYTRFISESAICFVKRQSDILRKYIKDSVFITTNGKFGNLDNHRMEKECLDVYTYDSYPNFAYCLIEDPKHNTKLNDRKWSNHLTEVRSICPHFGIMEQQSGANGWNTRMEAPAPKPGQMMLWAMQSVAHGADYISFFRWRTCTMGTEIYWHGILDYDNQNNRKLEEVAQIHKRIQNMEMLAGAKYKAGFAVIKDYSNIWDAQLDRWHDRLDSASLFEIFVASSLTHTPMDYVYLQDNSSCSKEELLNELSRYPVAFYPHPIILSDYFVSVLKEYVEQGGVLIMGCRAGQKDETGKCPMTKMPGLASELVGATVSEFTFVGPNDDEMYAEWNGKKIEAPIFNDILEVTENGAKVLGTYCGNYYHGKPALVENSLGKGKVIYYGATFTRENVKQFLEYTNILSPYNDIIEMSKSCELAIRNKDDKTYYIVLNYGHETTKINLKERKTDIDTKQKVCGFVELKPYETKVYY